MHANLYALGAIALWASIASLGLALTHVPPFLLTGIALIIGSLPAWPFVLRDPSQWRVPLRTLALGVYGLFAFHFLLFVALRNAPPVQANLVNYLWPLFIVLLSPVVLPGVVLRVPHVLAALLGFAGAAIAIAGGRGLDGTLAWGYAPALASALVWATYSLMTRRVAAFPTTAIGLFGLVSGVLSLLCHALLEPATSLSTRDWALLAVLGLGPLGASFFLWDRALKRGDARQIGVLSYITPVASTALLTVVSDRPFSGSIALATVLIVGAAILGMRAR
ncbi:DMT family transporter [Verminephrobacter aporrectodeae]|uniref:DMT family transporter n=1 Tax=Verminephrobacter aporrectodeae TaxID=1110389 RepID=UPI0022437706|nr:DMT family transporter [Verminephrobacter aporrectodeae]MCW8163672.1 DMT family transporter [Verminephrobacter aporrectodeae subsp. tuberculatae]MCW8168458.1 DMT family transporter [Verminephrobacter aporrectodeae subsp. tuberculatae]MCW8175352.1 DMT family transporter [Verminephrobacter aporrectodeae subsp. tuberculatae]MCW8202822.1 DMT family transporter [Verminephrobacter aporrectodeae subsp. tuberculatae]MCW8206910.1 DMT family transporter [Verminephrobacter aporrectodeae subsp. tubercu